MRHFLVASFLLSATVMWPGVRAHAACDDVSLTRAQLVRAISDREPVGPGVSNVSPDDYALYAFTEITGANGREITHTWFHDNQQAAAVTLAIGADRWRTWSSKRLGFRRDNNWRVEIRLDDDCLLATLSVGPGTDFSETAARIRALLDSGDVTGARLALGEARQDSQAPSTALEEIARRDIPLAQTQALLEEGNLYIARARLRPLAERWPDDARIKELKTRLAQALEQRQQQVTGSIRTLERVLSRLPPGAGTCEAVAGAWWQRHLDNEGLQILESHEEGQELRLLLLDSRSGATLSLVAPCLEKSLVRAL